MHPPSPTLFHTAAPRGLSVHPFTLSASIVPIGLPGFIFDGPAAPVTSGSTCWVRAAARVNLALARLGFVEAPARWTWDAHPRCVRITHDCPSDADMRGGADLAFACAVAETCGYVVRADLRDAVLFAGVSMNGEVLPSSSAEPLLRDAALAHRTIVVAQEVLDDALRLAGGSVRVCGVSTLAELFEAAPRRCTRRG